MLSAIAISLFTAGNLRAVDHIVEDHVIFVIGDETKEPAQTVVASGPAEPKTAMDIYAPFFSNPAQTYVDSDVGPVPLYVDVEYDGQGNPHPRIPEYFTKMLIDNPTEENAILYLAQQRVRWRKFKQASAVLKQVAVKIGYITPDVMPTLELGSEGNRSIHHIQRDGWTKGDQGVPVLTEDQARVAGIRKQDIPLTPGIRSATPVEVVMVWDWRDPYSQKGIPTFARWGKELNLKEMGPRFMTVSVDNDGKTLQKQLDYVDYVTEGATKFIENWTDTTNLIDDMRVRVTPTYLFFDRRNGRIRRLEGAQTLQALKSQLMEVIAKKPEDYDRMDPTWFREAEIALGTHRQQQPTDSTVPDATPIQPASQTVAPWKPGSGWIRPEASKKAPVKE
jgi:thiol-disulfide isomerase/thioredoxin